MHDVVPYAFLPIGQATSRNRIPKNYMAAHTCIPYGVLIWTLGEQFADLPHNKATAQIQIRHRSLY